jgi:hypothetical protein
MGSKKIILINAAIALLSALGVPAYPGAGSSGGGNSVVCRNASGQIQSAMVLDLYEAVQRDGLKLRNPLGDLDREYGYFTQELRRIVDDPRPVDRDAIDFFHNELKTYFYFAPIGSSLQRIPDIGQSISIPSGCGIEQTAVYDDFTHQISINSEIWAALDSMNQMALVAHELVYRIYRVSGDGTSENARRLVAQLYSMNPAPRQKDGIPENTGSCWTGNFDPKGNQPAPTQFYIYPDPLNPSGSILQFTQLWGRYTFSPTRVRLPIHVEIGHQVTDTSRSYSQYDLKYWQYDVTDPTANFDEILPLEGPVFKGYKIAVRYRFGENMRIAFLDPQNTLISNDEVSTCFDDARQQPL